MNFIKRAQQLVREVFGDAQSPFTLSHPDVLDIPVEGIKGCPNTPDLIELERNEHWYLFVPDELMCRCPKSRFLDVATFEKVAYTVKEFSAFTYGEYSYPVFSEKKFTGMPHLKVKGELYLVRPTTLLILDGYKGNTNFFTRKRVKITVPYRLEYDISELKDSGRLDFLTGEGYNIPDKILSPYKLNQQKAWMYVWNDEAHPVDAGFLFTRNVKHFRSRMKEIGEYYYHSRIDYQNST